MATITPSSKPSVAMIPVHRQAPTIERGDFARLEPPGAGQYWRLDLPLKETSTNQASHPDIEAGTVLLIREIESQVDGTPHVVHLTPHPDWYTGPSDEPWSPRFLYDDFLKLWSRAPDAQQVREREMQALTAQMGETQQAMLTPPPPAKVAGLLAQQPSPNAGGDTRSLATGRGLEDMLAHAQATKYAASERIKWITTHTNRLNGQTHKLARYHQERAESMLARAQASLKGLDKIFETVRNLKLYTGEDVSVVQVCNGDPAPPETRFTFYQDLLALDEELLINLDSGGLDHHDIEDLPKVLADPAVANRLIPAQRGFVLCRFRDSDKEFLRAPANAGIADHMSVAIANARENEIARRKCLLYRDGARFYIISSAAFKDISQLLPSTGEQNEYYLRETSLAARRQPHTEEDRITQDHLDFAAAQHAHLGALNDYARVLVLCWGLHDRTELFETTGLPKFSNWLDQAVQNTFMKLVSHDNMLGQARESYADYRNRVNQLLCAGATVIVDTSRDQDVDHAPGLLASQGTYNFRTGETVHARVYKPSQRFAIGRIHMAKGRPYVTFDAEYDGFHNRQRKLRAKWFMANGDEGFLVLDRLHAQDLDYYLTSRQQRRAYAKYVELFRAARAHVAARDHAEAPLREFLMRSMLESGMPHDPDDLPSAITSAIATCRTASLNKGLAMPDAPGWETLRTPLLNALHSALANHAPRIAAAAALATACGRTPLRLAHRGDDTWHLYATAATSERDDRTGPWPWVADLSLAFSPDGRPSVISNHPCVLQKRSGELLINEFTSAAEFERPTIPESLTLPVMLDILDRAEASASRASLPQNHINLVELAREGLEFSRRHSGRAVIRPILNIPMGTAVTGSIARQYAHDVAKKEPIRACATRPYILIASIDLWAYCYDHASSDQRADILAAAISHYENSKAATDRLIDRPAPAEFSPGLMALRQFSPQSTQRWFMSAAPPHVIPVSAKDRNEKWFLGNPTDNAKAAWESVRGADDGYCNKVSFCRITSLGPCGAELFPSLAAICDRPARPAPSRQKPSP